ncbi:hypothetical protein STVA_34280 [Allostella vacuolata]|nr:hypothetical protein STVA_34280 [Stella vacuolata]
MPRRLTAKTTLDSLKKQAKRWLKAVRAGDAAARDRLVRAYPAAPAEPGLRDVQHALAREHDLPGWAALSEALADRALARLGLAEQAAIVLRHCWGGDAAAAGRLLRRQPGIARHGLHAAVACGDLAEVRRHLAADPAGAGAPGGPLDWAPLLYLAYSRLPGMADADAALAIAGTLLDHGADPNARFDDGWGNPFTVLTGVIGAGEGSRPPHPAADALARLLIERGAEPYDTQALYNTSIVDDDPHWMDFLYRHSERRGDQARWNDPTARPALGGKVPMGSIDYLLGNAVAFGHVRRAEWLLQHGGDANGVNAYQEHPHHVEAQLRGRSDIADLLVRHGAVPVALDGQAAFQAACMRLDRAAARASAGRHPEYLADAAAMTAAIEAGWTDVAALLLELGSDANLADREGVRPLNKAIRSDRMDIVRMLLAHGADIDYREPRFGGSALGWAVHFGRQEMIALLAPRSRDVVELVYAGLEQRLDAVLAGDPALANARGPNGGATPLFHLPDDEEQAARIASLLLRRGADPTVRNDAGESAEDTARRRGLDDAARIIGAAARRR